MANLVGFQQDPQGPPGMGDFHFDDGRSLYAHDPEMAAQVQAPPPQVDVPPEWQQIAQQDNRVAGPGGGEPPPADISGNPDARNAPGAMNPMAGMNFKGAGDRPAPPPVVPQASPAAPPPDMLPAPGGGGTGPSEFDTNVQRYALGEMRKGGQRTPEKWVPKSKSETVESEGLPYNEEDAAARIHANQNLMIAKTATAATMADRALGQAKEAQAALPGLQAKAARAQQEVDAQHANYTRERADLQQMIDKSNSQDSSAAHWFADKSPISKIGLILGQAFGAYAATLSGGENWAQKQINNIMEHDIAAQKEQAKNGVDNALQRLKLRYGDMDQAEAALRMAQGNAVNMMQTKFASANQAQDVQLAHQEMLAKNDADMVANEQKFMAGSYGKHTTKLDVAHQAASGGGGPDIVALAKKLKATGLTDEQVRTAIFGHGGNGTGGDAIDRANVGTFDGQSREFTTPDARKRAEETMPELTGMEQKAQRLQAMLKGGITSYKDRATAKALADQLAIAYGPAFSGSKRVNEYEIEAGKDTFGHIGSDLLSAPTTDILGRAQAAIDTVLSHTGARKKELLEGSYRVKPSLGKNAAGKTERQYSYETATPGMEDIQ